MKQMVVLLLVVSVISPAIGQGSSDKDAYTLYRDSFVTDERAHIATFDSDNGRDYNRENCMLARDLFLAQPGVQTNFWCEPGRYRE